MYSSFAPLANVIHISHTLQHRLRPCGKAQPYLYVIWHGNTSQLPPALTCVHTQVYVYTVHVCTVSVCIHIHACGTYVYLLHVHVQYMYTCLSVWGIILVGTSPHASDMFNRVKMCGYTLPSKHTHTHSAAVFVHACNMYMVQMSVYTCPLVE